MYPAKDQQVQVSKTMAWCMESHFAAFVILKKTLSVCTTAIVLICNMYCYSFLLLPTDSCLPAHHFAAETAAMVIVRTNA